MKERIDLLVIGCGPAGMAAASRAAEHGLSVAIIEERASAGGQIYRGLADGPFRKRRELGADYLAGKSLLARFDAFNIDAFFGASLWRIDFEGETKIATFLWQGKKQRMVFRKLLIATGSIERPVAFEGWTLPGVMNTGAAQLLLKQSGIAPDGRIVLAGNGPLQLLFAQQLLSLGIAITAILDTAPPVSHAGIVLKQLFSLIPHTPKLMKGARMLSAIKRAGIPIHHNVSALKATGEGRLDAVQFTANGSAHLLKADVLLMHEGVIPNNHLSQAIGCRHHWDEQQACFRPELDEYGESSINGIFIAGDGASIRGAVAASATGDIAVLRILEQLQKGTGASQQALQKAMALRNKEQRFRPFLEQMYPPGLARAPFSDNTLICRCEEVTAGELRAAVHDGAIGPAQAKAFTRCGMGACQGRTCGSIVSRFIAEEAQLDMNAVGSYRVRFPLKPMTLGDMSDFDQEENHAN
ncbi:FAD/NAD(P)-dependent oxidoreductase [Pantoea ananatis]|uniref:FAD/NAD(P)-dependent oxidoreductase n=1 Tax=Pantoea ananas TaxID=553 RepID=UPI0011A94C62|nr:NAD(P)/FAD-dependent oxidoreductase [Pantoea ananatis]